MELELSEEGTSAYKRLVELFYEGDTYDAWGLVMGWLFVVADYIESNTPLEVPSEWEFRQSPCGPDEESFEYLELRSMHPPAPAVLAFGKELWRWREKLEEAGESY